MIIYCRADLTFPSVLDLFIQGTIYLGLGGGPEHHRYLFDFKLHLEGCRESEIMSKRDQSNEIWTGIDQARIHRICFVIAQGIYFIFCEVQEN